MYVGKAVNLKNRVKSYFADKHVTPKTRMLVQQISSLEYIIVKSEMDALILEANLIKEHQPRYNIILKDDKSHLYIKITLYEDLPRVSTCRQTDVHLDPKATYFGPFPSGRTVKNTLRALRRVFSYLAHNQPPVVGRRRPPQSYFYYNLTLEARKGPIDKKEYRKQIFQLVRFLEGKRQSVVTDIEKEMQLSAKSLNFERAALLKQQIDGMNYITQASISPDSYVSNPELMAERRETGLRNLADILLPYFDSIKQPSDHASLHRIECYDISNISGQHAVGSMVVFVDGEASKQDYRRFRIKRENVPNDVAMLEEVLRRRFKRAKSPDKDKQKTYQSFSRLPDLLLIDGGKGQIGAAMTVLTELDLDIPIVGMTKREEELLVHTKPLPDRQSDKAPVSVDTSTKGSPGKPRRSSAHGAVATSVLDLVAQIKDEQNYTIIRLPRGSEELFLIQRLRDEAHRFAINYHRKVRAKAFLPKA